MTEWMNKNQYCSISEVVEFLQWVQQSGAKKSLNNNKASTRHSSPGECVFQKTFTHTSHYSSICLRGHTHWLTSFRHRRTELERLKMTSILFMKTRCICLCVLRAARGALAFSMSIINCNSVKAVTDWRCWAVLFCQRAVAQPLFMLTCLLSQVWSPVRRWEMTEVDD